VALIVLAEHKAQLGNEPSLHGCHLEVIAAHPSVRFPAPKFLFWLNLTWQSILGGVRLGYSGIRIYSGIYSSYSAPGSRIGGMEIQVFRNENNSQNKRLLALFQLFLFRIDPKRTRP